MSENLAEKLSQSEERILSAIKDVDTRVGQLDARIDSLDGRVGNLEASVGSLDARMGNLDARVGSLDTWMGNLNASVGKIGCRLQSLERGQETMRLNIFELTNMAHNVNRDQLVLNDIIRQMQLDFLRVNERLASVIVNDKRQNSST